MSSSRSPDHTVHVSAGPAPAPGLAQPRGRAERAWPAAVRSTLPACGDIPAPAKPVVAVPRRGRREPALNPSASRARRAATASPSRSREPGALRAVADVSPGRAALGARLPGTAGIVVKRAEGQMSRAMQEQDVVTHFK